ncbi:MAG: hypothetical protein J6X18_13610 [Bacteroidales bacterium]|nr:hypothetical protein [Bacteroidales bacterium]
MQENLQRTEIEDFKPKTELNPELWHEGLLDSRVRLRLMDIADDFKDTLDIRWVKPEDVVLTGSMANYNWNDFSDIDVHIIMDYSKVYKDKKFVKSYFDAKKDLWKQDHPNLKVFGYPVELYVEDSENPSKAGGVYSLDKNEWLTEPKEMDDSKMDLKKIERKANEIMDDVDELTERLKNEKDLKQSDKTADKLYGVFEKLKDARKKALTTKERELSPWNVVWKILRAEGYLDKIIKCVNANYDRQNSIKESKTVILSASQHKKFFADYLSRK